MQVKLRNELSDFIVRIFSYVIFVRDRGKMNTQINLFLVESANESQTRVNDVIVCSRFF